MTSTLIAGVQLGTEEDEPVTKRVMIEEAEPGIEKLENRLPPLPTYVSLCVTFVVITKLANASSSLCWSSGNTQNHSFFYT